MKKLDVYLQEIKRQKISVDDLQHAAEILAATPQLPAELENPDLTREKREDLVRSLFPLAVRGIIEVLAQDQTMKMMPDLIKEAEAFEKPDKYLRCVLEYVKEPDEKQAAGIRKFLSEKYPGRELRIVKEEGAFERRLKGLKPASSYEDDGSVSYAAELLKNLSM